MRREVTSKQLLEVFVVIGGLAAIGWKVWERTGRLIPRPPLLVGVLFVLLIVFVLLLAWPVRRHLQGRATRALEPLRAARSLVFAQAAALTGAALSGWYAAQLILVFLGRDLTVYREAIWRFGLLALGAGLLAATGLLAQSWCRIERTDDPPAPEDSTN